jgi:methionyl-tRNA synthetase
MISYDDFAKLEIRIGEIRTVDIVEDADKLLRLTVDFGEETPRQIISGIRTYFDDPQWLVGKKCPFLVNLEPRTIRGFESQGMILAASHDTTLGLLFPHRDLPIGTKIK